jgi:hypothetical protein
MTYSEVTPYAVSTFEKPRWRAELTPMDEEKSLALVADLGDKVRFDTISPAGILEPD